MVDSNLVLRNRLGEQELQEAAFQKREVIIGRGEVRSDSKSPAEREAGYPVLS